LAQLARRSWPRRGAREAACRPRAGRTASGQRRDAARGAVVFEGAGSDACRHAGQRGAARGPGARLFQGSRQADDAHGMAQETTASQRRADALGLLA
jgi:hypothetical protein